MFLLNSQIPLATKSSVRTNTSPEVTHPFCRLPLPAFNINQRLCTSETCRGFGTGPTPPDVFSREHPNAQANGRHSAAPSLADPSRAPHQCPQRWLLCRARRCSSTSCLRCRSAPGRRNVCLLLFRAGVHAVAQSRLSPC